MKNLWQDIRYGLRMLGKNPGFTTIAVLTLALGIGANTAIFSLVDQILLQTLPVKNPDELVILRASGPKTGYVTTDSDDATSFSYQMYKGLRDASSVFSSVLARFRFAASIAAHGQTDRASGELVSGNYFETLGVRPAIGRLFTADDDKTPGAQPVAVLSYAYWQNHFGGDPRILNQSILVNNTELTVVGVSQAGFSGVQIGQLPDVFVPMMMQTQMLPPRNRLDEWNDYWLSILARVKPGMPRKQAEAGIEAAYRPLLEEQLKGIKSWNKQKRQQFLDQTILLSSGASGRTVVQDDSGTALIALFAMVALVLLIACTNVANLLLAKGAARQREFAIRSALGATRAQMMRQIVVESMLCAIGGGVVGIALGAWLTTILTRVVVSNTGITGLSGELNGSVLAFGLAAILLSGLVFGLIPAVRVTRTTVSQVLKDQGSTSSAGVSHVRFRKVLVGAQVGLTLLVLAGATLFAQTLWNLRNQNLGLKADNVVAFSISPNLNGYDTARSIALIDQLRERLNGLPGVRGVGSSSIPTLTGDDMGSNITVEGAPAGVSDENHVNYDAVSPAYFSTLGIPLVSGREFANSDGAKSPKVAIISEAMVKTYFPGRNPLGAHFAFGGGNKIVLDTEIVGVVKDVKQAHVRDSVRPFIYVPYAQRENVSDMTFYVRTQQDPMQVTNEMRGVVRDLDANLPIYDLKTMDRIVDEDLFAERMVATLSAGFGGLAALLAALGIYGVLAYLVVQRTREIGIRMALGAGSGNVRSLIVKEVASMLLIGAAVGLPAAYGLAHLSESILYGVKPSDPLVYVAGLALVGLIALIACYVPTRRATRVDPLVALRYE